MTMLVTGTLASSAIAYSATDDHPGGRRGELLRRAHRQHATLDYSEQINSTFWGPIIARRISLASSTVKHYVPIGTLMPGMPASYEDVVTITNEPGSWG